VPESRFCHVCGRPLPLDTPLPERFATPLHYLPPPLAERILASRGTLEGEYKQVTVLFCDITDSTPLTERLGPEGMFNLLNRFFELTSAEVHRYEGTMNHFLGDGFMALFGAPLALEHHECQAVLAALGIRGTLAKHARELLPDVPETLRVRLGLNTGPVVVGKIGDNLFMDFTAIGDTINVAARLQSIAEPGSILLSETTYRQARVVVAAKALGARLLKGKESPVNVYQVTALQPSPPPLVLSPFIARTQELAVLQEALQEVEHGHGRVVDIVGEPGMGKSRLVLEFRHSLAAQRCDYLEGRCVSYGRALPYLPLLTLLRAGCRLTDSDSAAVSRNKVRVALEAVGMAPTDALPFLLHLLGLEEEAPAFGSLPPETVRQHTLEVIREFCLRWSRIRPLVLAIEDVHWIDQASETLLAALVEALHEAAILLLTTCRPGYVSAWREKPYVRQLALKPLPEAASLTLLRSLPGYRSHTTDAIRAILTRSEGNPLFIEELTRSMAESPQPAPAIPSTLQGVLAARIDRLPNESKQLLQVAAVVGREFSADLLAAVWDGAADIPGRLQELTRLDFLLVHPLETAPGYVFKHALLRDAVYASLLESQRRKYHGTIGAALEQAHARRPHAIAGLLAYHYGQSDVADKAVDWAIIAAEQAQQRWALTEALTLAQNALLRLTTMPETTANQRRRIDAVIKQAEVRFALGQHAEQIKALEEIQHLVTDNADPPRRATWYYWMGFLYSLTGGQTATAIAYCRQATAIAETAGLEEIMAYAETCLAQVYIFSGELSAAMAAGERALAVFEARHNRWWACRALSQLSPAANALGQWEQSLAYCQRAMAHAVALDDLRQKVSALVRMASTYIQRGDWQSGLRHCEAAEALGPMPYDAAAVQAVRGYGLVKAGDYPGGIALLEAALAWYDRSHLQYTRCQFSLWLADAYLHSGQAQQALAVATQVTNISQQSGYRHLQRLATQMLTAARAIMG
jgi:class 3 adenylate cyclase/tetratricopeptide (TPR) repeat protein